MIWITDKGGLRDFAGLRPTWTHATMRGMRRALLAVLLLACQKTPPPAAAPVPPSMGAVQAAEVLESRPAPPVDEATAGLTPGQLELFNVVSKHSAALTGGQRRMLTLAILDFLKRRAFAIRASAGVDILDEYARVSHPVAALALYRSMADRKFGLKDSTSKQYAIINEAGEDVGRAILRVPAASLKR